MQEQGIESQEAFEEIQEMDMEDWAAIDNMAEQYYAETVREVQDARDIIPKEDLEPVEKSAKDLTKAMDSYRETEQDCGHPQKKTWKGYQKQHQENKESIRQYRETYQRGEALPVKEAAGKKATDSLAQSATYFEDRRKELQEKYQQEIAESQKERKALQEEVTQLKTVIQDLRESARKNELQLTMGYQECVAGYEALQERVEATQKRFWYVKQFRKDMADTIKETYDKVKDTPRRVKKAVENTACAVIDDAYTKTADVFYKTGQKIDQKRDQTLEHTRYWTEKRPEREEKKAQQKAAVYIRTEGPERAEDDSLEIMQAAQVGPLEKAQEQSKEAVYTQTEGQDKEPSREKGKAAHTLNDLKEGMGKAPEESTEKKAPEKDPYSREAIQELSEALNQQKQKLQENYKEWRQHFQHTDLSDRTAPLAIRDDMGPLEIMQAAQVGLPERSQEQAAREEAVNVQTAEKTTKVQQTVTVEKKEPERIQTTGHDIQKPTAGRHYIKNGWKGPERKGAER